MQSFSVALSENQYIGMNDKYPSHTLPRGIFQYIQNAYVDNNRMYKRGGTTAIATSLGAFLLNGGVSFERSNGNKSIIVSRNGSSNAQLYEWTGSGTFSAIGSANLTNSTPINFVVASDQLFGFNGVEVVDYDGTTVTKNRAGVPIGKFGVWFHNYLFVAGVSGALSRLYWSNLGTPTTFGGTDYVDINPNDGDMITGLGVLNDELIVFKQYSIWSISGWSGTTFAATTQAGQNTQNKASGVGTFSHRSIVSVGRDLYYLSFRGNIPHIRSLQQTVFSKTIEGGVISDEIENTMIGLNKSKLINCSGIYDGKYLYWAISDGSSSTNNLILVLNPSRGATTNLGRMQSWVLFVGANVGNFFSSTISGSAKVYTTDATANGNVYLFNDTSSYQDNGSNVVFNVLLRDMQGHPSRKSKFKYLYLKYQSGSSGTLNINARVDQASDFGSQEDLSLAGNSPGLGTFVLGTSILGGAAIVTNRTTFQSLTGHMLGVELEESTSNYCELYDIQVFGYLKGFRDS